MKSNRRKPVRAKTLMLDDEPHGNIISHITERDERAYEQSRLGHVACIENISLFTALNQLATVSIYDNTVLDIELKPTGEPLGKTWLATSGEIRVEGRSAREALITLSQAMLRFARTRIDMIERAMKKVQKASK